MTLSTNRPKQKPSTARRSSVIPELLAPAGDWECARAAVENGADAIYFGLEKFNARMRAHNFTEADLPKLMAFLHQRGVKGYVTFNTLIFENELLQAEEYLRAIIAAGVDAAIVQDIGICRLIRQISPDFPIHASTQMTVTSAGGVEFAKELGCDLVVLARECSLKEIEKIQESASAEFWRSPIPIEVFVHGALCVAYSGQCLTSEALGGRSANRGECAQACRLPYDLISDGTVVPLGDRKYLLSPQDLAGLDILPEIVRRGVASLKIEGRLKTPEYVANITRIYRKALDRIADAGVGNAIAAEAPREHYEMEMAFSRGIYSGWFEGINNQKLVHGRFGKKRGVYLGEVTKVLADSVIARLESALKPGDGIVFDAGNPEQQEQGGRVYDIRELGAPRGDGRSTTHHSIEARLGFGHGTIDFSKVHIGDRLWKTSDPELERELRRTFEGDQPRFQRPLQMEVHGEAGTPLTLIGRDEQDRVVRCESSMKLATAERQPLTVERLTEQLGRLGGTPFKLARIQNHLAPNLMLPVSELNRLRREIVEQLQTLRSTPLRWKLDGATNSVVSDAPLKSLPALGANAKKQAELSVLVRTMQQLETALQSGTSRIYCEFEDPKKYRDAVNVFKSSPHRRPEGEIFVAPPRIFKMGEEWALRLVRASEADGYLVRNYDHLKYFVADRKVGDFSLNVANHFTAEYFKNRFGLERLTTSYDLNSTQLEALLRAAPADWFEVTIHQHMPMFHMEHCVFCAFLSSGTDYTNCGRPCDKHDLKLRDRVGAEHPVKADAGCRNTVFQALAQTGADHVASLISLGVRHFRIEFVNETAEQTARTIAKYQQLLKGEISGDQVWRDLKVLSQLGVTRGPKRA